MFRSISDIYDAVSEKKISLFSKKIFFSEIYIHFDAKMDIKNSIFLITTENFQYNRTFLWYCIVIASETKKFL